MGMPHLLKKHAIESGDALRRIAHVPHSARHAPGQAIHVVNVRLGIKVGILRARDHQRCPQQVYAFVLDFLPDQRGKCVRGRVLALTIHPFMLAKLRRSRAGDYPQKPCR